MFFSYGTSTDPNDYALLGDEHKSNIAGNGTAIFSLYGKIILVRNALYVPALRTPLYSTQTNVCQDGFT